MHALTLSIRNAQLILGLAQMMSGGAAQGISSRGRACRASVVGVLITIANVCSAASTDPVHAGVAAPGTRWRLRTEIASAREHALSLRALTGYEAELGQCGDVMLGPLPEGDYTGEEAWLTLIAPVCAVVRRSGSAGGSEVFADMSRCTCSFGLPQLTRLQQSHVLVTGSRLPKLAESLTDSIAAPTLLIDRKRIEETGAASIPELLRYISQTAFHRGQGYRASGAQYAELRGLGAGYALVLINGRRAFGSAADPASGAFDLSMIPISAVARVEVSSDANSLLHGMDAIGGIVNVVLSDRLDPALEVSYGGNRGGGAHRHAALNSGLGGERGQIAVFADVERRDELLGRERDRWSNQDYRRFGGQDYRSRWASPPNITSVDGQNLPGHSSPSVAAQLNPQTGTFEFVEGRTNYSSLRAFQPIVPEWERATALAQGSLRVGQAVAVMELLAVRRENDIRTWPSVVQGNVMGATHPDNSFGVPVRVEAMLDGLPAPRYHAQTTSRRGVVAIEGQFRTVGYGAFVTKSDERSWAQIYHATDPATIARGLQADNSLDTLSLYSTVRPVAAPTGTLVDVPAERSWASATHVQASLRGPLLELPAGSLTLDLGVEHRRERVDFDGEINAAGREITSSFAQFRVPLMSGTMGVPGVDDVKLVLGTRRDNYSDIGHVTKAQVGLIWQITESISVRASSSDSFRPPSLAELHMPRVISPAVMFDPKRGEVSSIEMITGGNPSLRPTAGHSDNVGISFMPNEQLHLSAEYWRIRARGHISALAPTSLLASEDSATQSQVVREAPAADDIAAGRPGRLLSLNQSRANVGGATTQGVDLSIEAIINTPIGKFLPALSVSFTDKFLYSNLPITQAQMEDRVGVASEFGTIPAQRGIASLSFEHEDWRASVHARVISSYRDRSATTGAPMQRRIAGGALWDINISKKILGQLQFTVGAFNVTNWEPPFANAGGSWGFDASQGDLEGRQIYGKLTTTF